MGQPEGTIPRSPGAGGPNKPTHPVGEPGSPSDGIIIGPKPTRPTDPTSSGSPAPSPTDSGSPDPGVSGDPADPGSPGPTGSGPVTTAPRDDEPRPEPHPLGARSRHDGPGLPDGQPVAGPDRHGRGH
ncbi:hypothetical protein ACFCX0_28725 [Streptomyces sp. NPDC056352]|uniref:hypothetical protein n=1 Tax=Streptomyces sp. NPDC056352 TaxID=3345791 RepID=UPI0035E334A9